MKSSLPSPQPSSTQPTLLLLPPSSSSSVSASTASLSTPPPSPSSSYSHSREVPVQNGRVQKTERKCHARRRAIAKLRRMLPQDPDVVRCSELELINHIMDYILSLQDLLKLQANIADENRLPSLDIADLSRVLSRCHLCAGKPMRPTKQMCS